MSLPPMPKRFINKLSPREQEVYKLTQEGYPQKYIQSMINISSRAGVARIRTRILEKYGKWFFEE